MKPSKYKKDRSRNPTLKTLLLLGCRITYPSGFSIQANLKTREVWYDVNGIPYSEGSKITNDGLNEVYKKRINHEKLQKQDAKRLH